MADKYWQGGAVAVAQVSTATPANVEVDDVFSLLIDGDVIAAYTATIATVANVTAGLIAAWNASTDPRATVITATDDTTKVSLTSDVAGMPFTVTATAVDGGGTDTQTLTMATPTASSGPNDLSTAANWSDGAIPANSDNVTIDSGPAICWNLDALSAVALASLVIKKTFTNRIGLRRDVFATNADATTFNSAFAEYRPTVLEIGASVVDIGENDGPGTPAGSDRIALDLGATAAAVTVYGTAVAPEIPGVPGLRLSALNASTDIIVRSAAAGVGIESNAGDVGTVGDITHVNGTLTIGSGTTLSSLAVDGGAATASAAATVPALTLNGGNLTLEGDYAVTAATVNAGTLNDNHINSGGDEIATLTQNGGTVDARGSKEARTYGTVNFNKGAELLADAKLTITTLTLQATNVTLTAA